MPFLMDEALRGGDACRTCCPTLGDRLSSNLSAEALQPKGEFTSDQLQEGSCQRGELVEAVYQAYIGTMESFRRLI